MRGFLVRRVGPFPIWVWVIMVTVGVFLFLRFRGGGKEEDGSESSTIYDANNLTTQQSTLVPWSTDIFINVPDSVTPKPSTSPTPGPVIPPKKYPGPRRYMISPGGKRVWIDPPVAGQYSGKTQRIPYNKAETAPRRYVILETGKRFWQDLTGVGGKYSGKTQRVPFTGGGLPPATFPNRQTSVTYQVPPGSSGVQASGLARLFGFQGQARPFASNPLVIPT